MVWVQIQMCGWKRLISLYLSLALSQVLCSLFLDTQGREESQGSMSYTRRGPSNMAQPQGAQGDCLPVCKAVWLRGCRFSLPDIVQFLPFLPSSTRHNWVSSDRSPGLWASQQAGFPRWTFSFSFSCPLPMLSSGQFLVETCFNYTMGWPPGHHQSGERKTCSELP